MKTLACVIYLNSNKSKKSLSPKTNIPNAHSYIYIYLFFYIKNSMLFKKSKSKPKNKYMTIYKLHINVLIKSNIGFAKVNSARYIPISMHTRGSNTIHFLANKT